MAFVRVYCPFITPGELESVIQSLRLVLACNTRPLLLVGQETSMFDSDLAMAVGVGKGKESRKIVPLL